MTETPFCSSRLKYKYLGGLLEGHPNTFGSGRPWKPPWDMGGSPSSPLGRGDPCGLEAASGSWDSNELLSKSPKNTSCFWCAFWIFSFNNPPKSSIKVMEEPKDPQSSKCPLRIFLLTFIFRKTNHVTFYVTQSLRVHSTSSPHMHRQTLRPIKYQNGIGAIPFLSNYFKLLSENKLFYFQGIIFDSNHFEKYNLRKKVTFTLVSNIYVTKIIIYWNLKKVTFTSVPKYQVKLIILK